MHPLMEEILIYSVVEVLFYYYYYFINNIIICILLHNYRRAFRLNKIHYKIIFENVSNCFK